MIVRNYRKIRVAPVVKEPGVTVRWLVNEMSDAPSFAMRLYEIEPGATTSTCIHYWEHEVFVLSGEGIVAGGEGETPLGQGDVVYVPPGEHHQFVNWGDKVFRFLMVLPMPQCPCL